MSFGPLFPEMPQGHLSHHSERDTPGLHNYDVDMDTEVGQKVGRRITSTPEKAGTGMRRGEYGAPWAKESIHRPKYQRISTDADSDVRIRIQDPVNKSKSESGQSGA